MKLNVREVIKPAVALIVICLVSSLLLAGTNAITKDKILETQKKQAEQSRQLVFPEAASFGPEQTVPVEGGDNDVTYCTALDATGANIGYVFTNTCRGYGGDVTVMTGIDPNGTVVRTVILSMDDETPGLGQNAGKPDFLDQFTGKTGPFQWVKADGQGNDITGVTSASFTSKAVIACVNQALTVYQSLGGEQ